MSANFAQPVPAVPQTPMVDARGVPTPTWYQFFISLWQRTGGGSGSVSGVLDTIANIPGSLLYRAATAWNGLNPGAANLVLKMGAAVPGWALLDGKSFNVQPANQFFAGPLTSPADNPGFRTLTTADLDSVAGAVPGAQDGSSASAGNVGEYHAVTVAPGSAVALTSATAADIATLSLGEGDWDIWGNLGIIPAGGASVSAVAGWLSATSASDPGSPNGGAYVASTPASALTAQQTFPVGAIARQLASASSLHLSCNATFSGGTLSAFGFIGARRRR